MQLVVTHQAAPKGHMPNSSWEALRVISMLSYTDEQKKNVTKDVKKDRGQEAADCLKGL